MEILFCNILEIHLFIQMQLYDWTCNSWNNKETKRYGFVQKDNLKMTL